MIKGNIQGPATWLSCVNSIRNSNYCSRKSCPGLAGYGEASDCSGEKFEIQSTATGPIEYGNHIALKYWDWLSSRGRGEGTYWLSTYYGTGVDYLYTKTCVGDVFTEDDISRCSNEVFTILPACQRKDYGLYHLTSHSSCPTVDTARYLRNGDFIRLDEITYDNYKLWGRLFTGFIMKS